MAQSLYDLRIVALFTSYTSRLFLCDSFENQEDASTDLVSAAGHGDIESVQNCVAKGAEINFQSITVGTRNR